MDSLLALGEYGDDSGAEAELGLAGGAAGATEVPVASTHGAAPAAPSAPPAAPASSAEGHPDEWGDVRMPRVGDDVLPPLAAAAPDSEAQLRITERLRLMRSSDYNFTGALRADKEFNNPYLLRKVVQHYGIDEQGSNVPAAAGPGQYDMRSHAPDDYYEALAARQHRMEEAWREEQAQRSAVEFVPAGTLPSRPARVGAGPAPQAGAAGTVPQAGTAAAMPQASARPSRWG